MLRVREPSLEEEHHIPDEAGITPSSSARQLTISNQHQGGLGLSSSILDLHGVCPLAVLSEVIQHHLDNACGYIMTHLSLLQNEGETKGRKTNGEVSSSIWCFC